MSKKRIFASYQFTTKNKAQGLGRIIVTTDGEINTYDKI